MSNDFLEEIERQLVAATESGLRARRWRWRWAWMTRMRLPWRAPTVGVAVGMAAALGASAIAATLTLPASHPQAQVASRFARARSFTTPGAVPAGFQPESFTAISEYSWWLLGTAPCGGHTCTVIVRTEDGGSTFTRIPAPPTGGVGNLRFANARDGYAFGPQLWTTHNGGRTWTEPHIRANELAAADGYVYALSSTGAPVESLMRSPVRRNAWTVAPGLSGREPRWLVGQGVGGLWVQGNTVIIQAGNRMLISNDQGRHFSHARGVVNAGDCGYDAVADPFAIWALCSTGMAPDDILLSTNSGDTFTAAAQVPDGPVDSFAAASSTVAVASGQGPLFRTTDGGASWSQVAVPSAGWTYLGFTDATHGVALGNFGGGGHQHGRLYYTTDGGASYHEVPIGSK
ncbi:MAG TPA: hypothetical protein VMV16_01845 [Solirubrobacteraceae bacterium]|nr:hypothetical protein [Solirubrobacteraceae bacterium]